MKKSVPLIIITFIFALIASIIGQEICDSDKCFEEKDIAEVAKDFNKFNSLSRSLQDFILEENFEEFLINFKQANPTEQAKFFLEKDSSKFLLNNDRRGKILKSFSNVQKQDLFKELVTKQQNKFYTRKDGKPFQLKEFKIKDDNNELKLDGLKFIGSKGGYINIGEGPDQIHKKITHIEYNNGMWNVLYKDHIGLEFEKGTPAPNGGFFIPAQGEKDTKFFGLFSKDKKLKLVGGEKGLNFLYEIPGQPKEKNFKVELIEENGKQYTQISLKEDSNLKSIGIRFLDVKGNDYFIGSAVSRSGKLTPPIVRIDEKDIISIKSGITTIKDYGKYQFTRKEFTPLLGNVFNEPGKGVKDLETRITDSLGPGLGKRIKENIVKIFEREKAAGKQVKEVVEEFSESGDLNLELLDAFEEDSSELNDELKNTLLGSVIRNIGVEIGKSSKFIPTSIDLENTGVL